MAELPDTSLPPLIVWFRRDLRLADNPALAEAAAGGQPVIPLYILEDPPAGRAPGAASRWWLDKSLRALEAELRSIGSRLVLRRGEPLTILRGLARETGARGVSWNRRYEPEARERDSRIKQALGADGLEVRSCNAALMNEPWTVLTGDGGPYKVFTAYWKRARSLVQDAQPAPRPRRLAPPPVWPESEPLDSWGLHPNNPDWSVSFRWRPGEAGAQAALDHFVDEALGDYSGDRDIPAKAGASRLSPHLHFGEIGPRQVLRRLQLATEHGASHAQAEAFLRELGWREFNHQLLFHFPELRRTALRPEFGRFAWLQDEAGLRAWTRGETGYPMVDAAMRELWATGFMHNRARMIAASFLVKDLLVDWRCGEAWFWDTLVDADEANNAANWQWVAGSGADAQPFFRIFNPVAQGERFDPDGAYVRRWIPELAHLPAALIHTPWKADPAPHGYPPPIVQHARARERALAAYRQVRG